MLIRTRDASEPAPSEITPHRVYRDRRRLLAAAGFVTVNVVRRRR